MVNKTRPHNQRATSPNPLLISELRSIFSGDLISTGDPEYDSARMVASGAIDRHPAVIIRVRNVDEVARVIALARDTGICRVILLLDRIEPSHCFHRFPTDKTCIVVPSESAVSVTYTQSHIAV